MFRPGLRLIAFSIAIIFALGGVTQQITATQPHKIVDGIPRRPRTSRSTADTVDFRLAHTFDRSVGQSLTENQINDLKRSYFPSLANWLRSTLRVITDHRPFHIVRDCAGNLLDHEGRVYCKDFCADDTLCGQAVVPADHLEGCHICTEQPFCPECIECQILNNSGPGLINKDYSLYVTAVNESKCRGAGVLFTSTSCQQVSSGGGGRPIAGNINVCPYSPFLIGPEYFEYQFGLFLREMIKLLGFSSDYFLNSQRQPVTNVVQNYPRNWMFAGASGPVIHQQTSHWVVTPKVKSEAQTHFGCSDLVGMPLKISTDQTPSTYWDQRVAWGELMTAEPPPGAVVSRLTLSALQDTGWYNVSFDKANPLVWGQGLGCSFVTESCLGFMVANIGTVYQQQTKLDVAWGHSASLKQLEWGSANANSNNKMAGGVFSWAIPFTSTVRGNDDQVENKVTRCSIGHRFVGESDLRKQTQEVENVYFAKWFGGSSLTEYQHYGGSDLFMDNCPYWKPVVQGKTKLKLLDCRNASALPQKNVFLERYGIQSHCINFAVPWTLDGVEQVSSEFDHLGSGCYMVKCLDNQKLTVAVAGIDHPCSGSGNETLNIDFTSSTGDKYTAQLECPPYAIVCGQTHGCPSECNHRGSCRDGKCFCRPGFAGTLCDEVTGAGKFLPKDSGVPTGKVDKPAIEWTASVIVNYVVTFLAALCMIFLLIWVLKCGGLHKVPSQRTDPAQERERLRQARREALNQQRQGQSVDMRSQPPAFRVRPETLSASLSPSRPLYSVQATVGPHSFKPMPLSSQSGHRDSQLEAM
eukprot:m.308673 g.308673  ORF g.308673 m.308673 type:complete len:807 (+) comp44497_c0_seq1:131-2551(+)